MAMPEAKIGLEPGHHGTRFHAGLEHATVHESLGRREPAEFSRTFARLR
jgi:hypothetical protein